MTLKEAKTRVRKFIATAYDDERLAALLAHATDDKLVYQSCCCFIGIPTADHALRSKNDACYGSHQHYTAARELPGAVKAEIAYYHLGNPGNSDSRRRRRLIPIVKSAMRQRAARRVTVVEVPCV